MMRTATVLLACCAAIVFASASPSAAQERPTWDQARAVARVKAMLAEEAKGQPWDQIPWLTDVEAAVARAQAEDKPLFVYWYVDKGGPKAAPC